MAKVTKRTKGFYFVIATLFYGIILRLKMLLDHQSLFLDEANVAQNLYELSFGELFGILRYQQYVPPIFSVFSKLMGNTFGFYEVTLRVIPLFGFVFGAIFLYKLLKEFIPDKFIILPMFFLAGSFIFVKYSIEIKQYTIEFAIGTFLMWYAIRSKFDDSFFYFKWVFIGIISIYTSFTSIFFLVGIGIYFLIEHFQRKLSNKQLIFLVGTGISWIIAFGTYYYFVLMHNVKNPELMKFHEQYYLKFPTDFQSTIHTLSIIKTNIDKLSKLTFVFSITAISGLILGYKTYRNKITPIILPLILVSFASMLHKFTFIERVVLPFYSIGLFFVAIGIFLLIKNYSNKIQNFSIALSLIMIIGTFSIEYISTPYIYQEMRNGIEYIQAKVNKNDEIWVFDGASPILDYYTNVHPNKIRFALSDKAKIIVAKTWKIPISTAENNRIFLLLASIYDQDREKVIQTIKSKYNLIGLKNFNGVFVYEFKLKQ